MRNTSRLSGHELAWIEKFLSNKPIFRLYHRATLDALNEGLDNREYLISGTGAGLVMSIRFDELRITTTIGELNESELSAVALLPEQGEIHAEQRHESFLLKVLSHRIRDQRVLKYYLCDSAPPISGDGNYRRLRTDDFEKVHHFFKLHYPGNLFSSWMLEKPFIGLFEHDELIATAGTIIFNRELKAANLGNFLTHPDHRGRGMAKKAAIALMHELRSEGITEFSLGTSEDNTAAWRAYEAVGFRCVERRPEIYLGQEPRGITSGYMPTGEFA